MGKKHKKNKKHSYSLEPPDFIPELGTGREMRVVLKLPTEPHPRPSYLEELELSPSPPNLQVSIPLAALRKRAVEGGEEAVRGDHRHHHHKHKKHKKKKHGGLPPGEGGGMPQHLAQYSRLDASSGQQDSTHHVTYRQHHGGGIQGDAHPTVPQQRLPSFHIRKRRDSSDFLPMDTSQHTPHRHHQRDSSPPEWGSAHWERHSPDAATTLQLHQHAPSGHHKHRTHVPVSEGQVTWGEEQHVSKHHHHHHSPHKKHHKKHHAHPEPEKEPQSLHVKIESGVEALQPHPNPSYLSPEELAPPTSQDPLGSAHGHKRPKKKKKKHKHSKGQESLPLAQSSTHFSSATPYSHEQPLTVDIKPNYPQTGRTIAGKSIDNQAWSPSEDLAPSPKRPRTEKPHPYPSQAAKTPKPPQPARRWPQMRQEDVQEEEDDDEIERELEGYHRPESRPVAHSGKPRAFTRESKPSFTQERRPKPAIHISQLKYPHAENTAPPKPHPPVVTAPPKPHPPVVATPPRPEPAWPRAATPPERDLQHTPVPPPSSSHLTAPPSSAHLSAPPPSSHLSAPPPSAHLSAPPPSAHLTAPPPSSHLTAPPHSSHPTAPPPKQVVLSKSALRFFLKSVHHHIQRRDPQGIFAEPVTDDIAPGYSKIIHHPMDLSTMAAKVETNGYPSVNEFKDDFVLMCNNAMTYNTPDTLYYTEAKKLLTVGLKVIAKETSMRPDIRHGRVASAPGSASVSPLPLPKFRLPLPTSTQLDYSSPCLCRINLGLLRPSHTHPPPASVVPSPSAFLEQLRTVDVTGLGEVGSQSHLTKVSVGVAEEEGEDSGSEWAEEVLVQVQEAAEAAKENLHASRPGSRVCFLSRDVEGRTSLSILNPDSLEVPSCKPVDLTALSERVRMGNNAATVLKSELPVCKTTPISYLMYGPFGSFAPVYDSAFASLTKTDSDLLLSTYGNELGISYAHSLQQFVKGTGSFVSEMADAVLNGLTNNRHANFLETRRARQEREKQLLREAGKGNEKSPQVQSKEQVASEGDGGTQGGGSSPLADEVMPEAQVDGGGVEEGGSVRGGGVEEGGSVKGDSSGGVEEGGSVRGDSSGGVEEGRSVTGDSSGGVEEGRSVRGDSSGGESGEGVDETTSVRPENADSTSEEEHSSMELEINQETRLSEAKQDESLRFGALSVDQHLEHSAALLSELHRQQVERLGRPPQKSGEGHVILPGTSAREAATASKITQELAALTGQVRPRDVVSVQALHQAMSITAHPTEKPHSPAEQKQNSPEAILSRQSE